MQRQDFIRHAQTSVPTKKETMQWTLFLVMLMSQFSFFSCHLYEYHLIIEEKTWDDAQNYCRDKYTDLATVCDVTDTRRLGDLVTTPAWIGLHSILGKDNRMWHWSLTEMPGVEFDDIKSYFGGGEPNPLGNIENCVEITGNKLNDIQCSKTHEFICFDEREEPSERLQVINLTMNWTQAQKYCRDHHTDLLSGLDQLEEIVNKSFSHESMWIGLFRDTWRWSNGSKFSFRNWGQGLFKDGHDKKECATVLNRLGEWGSDDCNKRKTLLLLRCVLHRQSDPGQKKLNWEDALYYCRENYDDLVSITNDCQQRLVQAKAKEASTSHVWLGLRYTCTLDFWFWISDEVVHYQNWAQGEEKNGCDMSGAMATGGSHKWFKKQDTETFNSSAPRLKAQFKHWEQMFYSFTHFVVCIVTFGHYDRIR
ncbi:macrophage mannose receptor 1-like [Notolabrus celidotus]|uniref:macrophage mannose receptor 1-like n=1 Tax=Notolabrus celidotus TaxID=1203425 RepID=UPI0014900905|nr:macrophage mannose receptor 1-like [Notolabrus celidotus]